MTDNEKLYVEKLESFFEMTHNCYCSHCQKLKKELSALKSELKEERSGLKKINDTEWADPVWKRDQDVKEVVKEEQSPQDLSGDYDLVSKFNLKKEEEQPLSVGEILQEIEDNINKPLITARFGNNWKKHAKENYDLDAVIDIAWKQGRKSILLVKALEAMHEYRDQGRDRKPSSKELNTL